MTHLTDAQAQQLVDGTLPREACCACEAHAACCPECADTLASYRALADALAGLPAAEPPPDFTAAVLCCIDDLEAERRAWRRAAGLILGAAAAVAVALFALAGASAWAPVLSRLGAGVADLAGAASLAADVLGPVVRALRLQIVVVAAAVALPLLVALSRLVPRTAEARS